MRFKTNTMDSFLQDLAADYDYIIKDEEIPQAPEELLDTINNQKFSLLYIVGDSGKGKTSILNSLVTDGYEFLRTISDNKTPIAAMFSNKDEATFRLNMSGLSSVPVWFRTYDKISRGEQARADIAVSLKSFCVVDEFTSNLDRLTARSLAYSIRKYAQKYNMSNIVLAGCQYDVIQWLCPDYVYDLNNRSFVPPVTALPRWECSMSADIAYNTDMKNSTAWEASGDIVYDVDAKKLVVRKVSRDRWNLYSGYHYLSPKLLDNATCWEGYIKIDTVERGVCFQAVCPMPSGTVQNAIRGHRLVVTPSCQGIGIGTIFSEVVAEHYKSTGYRYFSKTSHPRLGEYRDKNDKWMPTKVNHKSLKAEKPGTSRWQKTERRCYSHEYCGNDNTTRQLEAVVLSKKTNISYTLPEGVMQPLKTYGVISVDGPGRVCARINHKKTFFSVADHGSVEEATTAASKYLAEASKNCVTNLYHVKNGSAYIDLSIGNKGDDYLVVGVDDVHLLAGQVWRRRNNRVFKSQDGGRVWIETVLYPGRKISHHLNGNVLDYRRSNVIL